MRNLNFSNYQSPFSWRYGSDAMREIWSEKHKYQLWRKIWVALASVQHEAGLLTSKELADLKKHQHAIDIQRILEIEQETKHDVVAGIKEFGEKVTVGGGKIHLGATSMDIVDNAEIVRMNESLDLITKNIRVLLSVFSRRIDETKKIVCMGYTHLQPAEPTTVGYRLSMYAQDLLTDLAYLNFLKRTIKGKGMKGAVGTRASYVEVLKGTVMTAKQLDKKVMKLLGIDGVLIASQVSPRKFDYLAASVLSSIASSLAKFAGDLRILQSPLYGEWSEPFGKKQVGSSAMPFKKNPLNSEKICSLARYVSQLPPVLLENASLSYLERTLDDSANRRITISEGFLAVDEILKTTEKMISGMNFHTERIALNLNQFGPFAATERVIIAAVKNGADRQSMHELMRRHAMEAWEDVQKGKPNPLLELLSTEEELKEFLTESEIKELFDITGHVGDAPQRVSQLLKRLQKI